MLVGDEVVVRGSGGVAVDLADHESGGLSSILVDVRSSVSTANENLALGCDVRRDPVRGENTRVFFRSDAIVTDGAHERRNRERERGRGEDGGAIAGRGPMDEIDGEPGEDDERGNDRDDVARKGDAYAGNENEVGDDEREHDDVGGTSKPQRAGEPGERRQEQGPTESCRKRRLQVVPEREPRVTLVEKCAQSAHVSEEALVAEQDVG